MLPGEEEEGEYKPRDLIIQTEVKERFSKKGDFIAVKGTGVARRTPMRARRGRAMNAAPYVKVKRTGKGTESADAGLGDYGRRRWKKRYAKYRGGRKGLNMM